MGFDYFTSDRDQVLNYISDPKNLKRALVDADKTFDYIDQMRRFTDDHAKQTNYGPVAGGAGDLKIVARVPESLLIVALSIEPNLLKDKKLLYKWLDANPHFYAYSRKKKRGGK